MHREYTAESVARFWRNVDKSGDCWLWTKSLNDHGYGRFSLGEKIVKAHHVAWELADGPIPSGLHVLHTCDTPRCTRNDDSGVYEVAGIAYERRGHLWLGTHAANMLDKVNKGRQSTVSDGADRRAKLTRATIPVIREQYANGMTLTDLARLHGMSIPAIYQVVNRLSWKHVP